MKSTRTSVIITTFGTFEVLNDEVSIMSNMIRWSYKGSIVFNCLPELYLGGYKKDKRLVNKVD